jgi:hypothetical protein
LIHGVLGAVLDNLLNWLKYYVVFQEKLKCDNKRRDLYLKEIFFLFGESFKSYLRKRAWKCGEKGHASKNLKEDHRIREYRMKGGGN